MSDPTGSAGNNCYRHPDRQSFVLCQRCGRTICPACQTQAAVGVHCPECVNEARQTAPKTKSRVRTAFSSSSDRPVVTYSIMALCAVVFLLQQVTGGFVTRELLYAPIYTLSEPWRMVTTIFTHGGILHILFNMYTLYIFGPVLERMLGRARYIALYLLAGFGGSVAVLLLTDPLQSVVGASGAIFGLMGAYLVILRHLGGQASQLLVLVGLNLVIGFLPGMNVAWQAHVGGLVAGALIGLVFTRTRQRSQRRVQNLLVGLIGAGLVAITVGAYVLA